MLTATSSTTSGHVTMQFPEGVSGDPSGIQAFSYRNGVLVNLQVRLDCEGFYAVVFENDSNCMVHIEIHKPENNKFVLKHLFDSDDVTVSIPEAK